MDTDQALEPPVLGTGVPERGRAAARIQRRVPTYYDDAVPLCIQSKAAMCPIELEEQKETEMAASQNSGIGKNTTAMSRPVVSVYVASLVGGHYESLKRSVVKLEPEMYQRFVVVAQVRHEFHIVHKSLVV